MAKDIDSFSGPYRFLSNFYPAPVYLDGIEYPTVEHAYQAAKTTNLGVRWKILETLEPKDVRRIGRRLPDLREDWDTVRISVMEGLLRQKFASGSTLGNLLIGTRTANLVEGNWWGDRFWGVCEGSGENNLGKLLMKIRADLIKENQCIKR